MDLMMPEAILMNGPAALPTLSDSNLTHKHKKKLIQKW